MKQVKGFVEASLVERFGKGSINFLTLSNTQGHGFETPVTLSPAHYEAMWKEFEAEAIWDGSTWKLQLPRNWHDGIDSPMMQTKCTFLIRVKRKHTAQAEPDEGCDPKPEEK